MKTVNFARARRRHRRRALINAALSVMLILLGAANILMTAYNALYFEQARTAALEFGYESGYAKGYKDGTAIVSAMLNRTYWSGPRRNQFQHRSDSTCSIGTANLSQFIGTEDQP